MISLNNKWMRAWPRLAGKAEARASRLTGLGALAFLMLLPTASCVPAAGGAPTHSASALPTDATPTADETLLRSPASAAVIASFTAPAADPAAAAATDPQAVAVPPGAAPAINATIPFVGGPNPAADAFFLRLRGAADRQRSLQCLTEAIYYEAASESDDGQRAVAQVVLNRMRHPAYPATVCGVVYQNAERWLACQFSFACDGARARVPSASGWARARTHAAQALAGRVHAPVGLATHYHTWNVVPFWAHKLEKTAVVGAHIFYRLNGPLGRGPAFRQRHAGFEPFPTPPRLAPPATAPQLALAPILPVKLGEMVPPTPGKLVTHVRPEAVPLPAGETLTMPKAAASPIMQAVEGSTVRDAFKNSGAVRPEFAAKP